MHLFINTNQYKQYWWTHNSPTEANGFMKINLLNVMCMLYAQKHNNFTSNDNDTSIEWFQTPHTKDKETEHNKGHPHHNYKIHIYTQVNYHTHI